MIVKVTVPILLLRRVVGVASVLPGCTSPQRHHSCVIHRAVSQRCHLHRIQCVRYLWSMCHWGFSVRDLRGSRTCHPQICLFGIQIILS